MAEYNFDGLVGPTHNYAGLSDGNKASSNNSGSVSRPREAALQGLAKMRFVASLGVGQGVLPPHARPHGPTLERLGLGSDLARAMKAASQRERTLVSSAAGMWTANAATVSASADTADSRVHFTPANLVANAHRAIEAEQTTRTLRAVFASSDHFVVHESLPPNPAFSDEGAANHTRLTHASGSTELYVYGREASESPNADGQFPRRQTRQASEAVARLHGVRGPIFLRQSAAAIDAGAFHNDVVAVGHENVFFYHQHAFESDPVSLLDDLDLIHVAVDDISLGEAVSTYLFNSQLLTVGDGSMMLLAPTNARENEKVRRSVGRIVGDSSNPIDSVHYMDLKESMRNGGGPACLRLRVELGESERSAVAPRAIDPPFDELEDWVWRHYREELSPNDLADPSLGRETRAALDELTRILEIGDIYPFQRS